MGLSVGLVGLTLGLSPAIGSIVGVEMPETIRIPITLVSCGATTGDATVTLLSALGLRQKSSG